MNDDDNEKRRLMEEIAKLKSESKKAKQEQEDEKSRHWWTWFLCIWFLPVLGIHMVQGDDLPPTGGPDFPIVGHMTIEGMWTLGVPLVTFLFLKFSKR